MNGESSRREEKGILKTILNKAEKISKNDFRAARNAERGKGHFFGMKARKEQAFLIKSKGMTQFLSINKENKVKDPTR